jgi:hypothetical protein
MSLFAPANPAAQQQAAYMGALAQTGMAQAAQGSITDYTQRGLDALTGGFGAQRTALTSNFDPALSALQGGYGSAYNDLTSNYNTGLADISRGISGYDPYTAAGTTAQDMQLKALGLGGPAGYSSAMSAFTASPQYQYNLDQATGNAVRGMNRYGMGTGGNSIDAITRLGSNLASGEFNNWLANLNTVAGRGLTAASGQGGLYSTRGQLTGQLGQGLSTLDTNRGIGTSNLYGSLGTSLGNSFANQGTGSANLLGAEGTNIAGIQTGLGRALADAYTHSGDAQANADAANQRFQTGLIGTGIGLAGNILAPGSGALTSGLSSGLSSLAGATGLGGIGSSLSPVGAGMFSGLGLPRNFSMYGI